LEVGIRKAHGGEKWWFHYFCREEPRLSQLRMRK
jgi:hypothetical protein